MQSTESGANNSEVRIFFITLGLVGRRKWPLLIAYPNENLGLRISESCLYLKCPLTAALCIPQCLCVNIIVQETGCEGNCAAGSAPFEQRQKSAQKDLLSDDAAKTDSEQASKISHVKWLFYTCGKHWCSSKLCCGCIVLSRKSVLQADFVLQATIFLSFLLLPVLIKSIFKHIFTLCSKILQSFLKVMSCLLLEILNHIWRCLLYGM